MQKKLDRALLERIFSDAHIVDIDFSLWDKYISILAISDHFENWHGRAPLVIVEFKNVKNISFNMPSADMRLSDPEKHLQWNVDSFEIRESDAGIWLRLFGSAATPILNLECDSIEARQLSNKHIDSMFPNWNRPFAGFIRQGIEEMIKKSRHNY